MEKTFPHGVTPGTRKELTEHLEIEVMPAPKTLAVSMSQHAGKPAVAVVQKGDKVKEGQLIAEPNGNGAKIFAPCSGTVIDIANRPTNKGAVAHIVIENDFSGEKELLSPLSNPSREEIIQRIADCGIVGMGGAGFPTASKLGGKAKIDTLLVNGAECEPYITGDYRIMLEYTDNFLTGVKYAVSAVGATRAVIGIESIHAELKSKLEERIAFLGFEEMTVELLKPKYPQGSDKQLIYAITGQKIAKGVRSSSYGLAVINVHTAYSIYLGVDEGIPSYYRVVTVTGKGINTPKNLIIYNGTTYKDVIDFCGGISKDTPPLKMIAGGPMMGHSIISEECTMTKTSGCLLMMSDDETFITNPSPCINCGKCAAACPMNLMPMYIDAYTLAGKYKLAEKYGASYCLECGCCSYVCPAKRQLVQSARLAKQKLKEEKK